MHKSGPCNQDLIVYLWKFHGISTFKYESTNDEKRSPFNFDEECRVILSLWKTTFPFKIDFAL